MEAKRIYILFTFLRAGFKKTTISPQLNVNRMTVHLVESLKNRPQSGKPQVSSQAAIKKTFDNYQNG